MVSEVLRFAAAVILAAGIAAGGWFVGDGVIHARTGDRVVSVKGLAERAVQADLALWLLRFVATGDDLAAVQAKIRQDTALATGFLAGAGINEDAIEVQALQVTDVLANPYRSGGPVEKRFIIAQTLGVRTTDVAAVAAASQRVGELVEAGVVLSAEGSHLQGPMYLFTRLNDIKPEMIREATANARDAAEQFAADSGAALAAIRSARQGVFQILARDKLPGVDEHRQIAKTVRVVSTVDFALAD